MGFVVILLGSAGATAPAGKIATEIESSKRSSQLPIDPRVPLTPAAEVEIEATLARMSLQERVGQVLMIRAFGKYYPADARARQELVSMVQELALGGVILFRSQAYEAAALLHDLQLAAAAADHLPLVVAADFEWGADFRIEGAIPSPTAMAVGATYDPAAAEWMGRASARDARALGVHWIFAPVADVNVNPSNPVINVRAFGEDPEHVGDMVAAFIHGAQQGGVLATAKHFPGHGDTAVDSHIALPVLDHDNRRLQTVELTPFRAAIDAGVASIMTAHIAVPALTGDSRLPATLSYAVLTDLLRTQLDFRGLVVTDAMEMGGISRRWWGGQAAVEALAAGADMVLMPPSPRAVHAAIVGAVERGDLGQDRLDDAVRAVLQAKARLGLREGAVGSPLTSLTENFAPASDLVRSQEVSDSAVTVLRDRDGLLPLDARDWNNVVVIGVSDNDQPAPTESLVSALSVPLAAVTAWSVDGRTRGDEAAEIVTAASKARVLILAVRVRVRTSTGRIALPRRQAQYAAMLADLEVPTIVVALGSPYAVAAFPHASTVLTSYGWSDPLQRAVARAITGEIAITGRLPVSVPGLYPVGHGNQRDALDAKLAPPADVVYGTLASDSPPGEAVDLTVAAATLQRWADAGAFPGAVYAVGYRRRLVGLGSVGKMSYEDDALPMPVDALFDLASLTKVLATTPVAMRAVERGNLRLDYPVQALVPEFQGAEKSAVTIRQLLTHTSGLPAYVEFFRDHSPDDAGPIVQNVVLEKIYAIDLVAPPGSRYAYSDLGILLLGEVLSRALGEPFTEYAQRELYKPLGMHDTMWNPPAAERQRIPPTEYDTWRGVMVHGVVHDENAYAIGGVASHAGLFSTAQDLASYAQMMLNLGSYDHARVLRRSTINLWRRPQDVVEGNSRGLGWDTARGSQRWSMFDASAYGHTGFTGTSLWIDSTRSLFVILLTNRVHPTRENQKHIEARVEFHREVVRAIDQAR